MSASGGFGNQVRSRVSMLWLFKDVNGVALRDLDSYLGLCSFSSGI